MAEPQPSVQKAKANQPAAKQPAAKQPAAKVKTARKKAAAKPLLCPGTPAAPKRPLVGKAVLLSTEATLANLAHHAGSGIVESVEGDVASVLTGAGTREHLPLSALREA